MKLKLLFISALFASFVMNAQFTVETHDGDPIVDGQIYSTGQLGLDGSLDFYVRNESSEVIEMSIEFVDAINADGSEMELCFGDCYTGITVGTSYPIGYFISIEPGETQTSNGDHFLNNDPGNGIDQLDYIFKFYQVDGDGNQIGTPLTMTYRYDPLLGVNDNEKLDISVYPTITSGKLTVETVEVLEVKVYDLQGRLVKTTGLNAGQNQIDMSNVASQMYFLHFKNEQGQIQITKIIIN